MNFNLLPFKSNLFSNKEINDKPIENENLKDNLNEKINSNNLFLNPIEDIPIDNRNNYNKLIVIKTSKYNDVKKINFGLKPSLCIQDLSMKILNCNKKIVKDELNNNLNELKDLESNLKIIKSKKIRKIIKISSSIKNSFCEICNIKFDSKECKGSHKARFHPSKKRKSDIKLKKFIKRECQS